MTSYAAGHAQEETATEYMKQHGFTIVELNWKTKYCKIDIVAEKTTQCILLKLNHENQPARDRGWII